MGRRRQDERAGDHGDVELLSDTTVSLAVTGEATSQATPAPLEVTELHDDLTDGTQSASTEVRRRSGWPIAGVVAIVVGGVLWASNRTGTEPDASVADQPTATVVVESEIAGTSQEEQPAVDRLADLVANDRLYLVPVLTADPDIKNNNVLVVGLDEYRGRAFDFRASIGGVSAFDPGIDRNPLLITNQGLVVVGTEGIYLQDTELSEPALAIGEGSGALAGPNDNSIWILGPGEETVELYDLSSRRSITEYSIASKGQPLMSVATGIVLANESASPTSDFVYWEPIHGLLELADTKDLEFYGANGSTAIFGNKAELVVFDMSGLTMTRRQELVDGQLAGTRVPTNLGEVSGSSLSPDGTLLAATIVRPFPEAVVINLVDTQTGTTVGTIPSALQSQYRWSGPATLLYMRPGFPGTLLAERNTQTGIDRDLLSLTGAAWRYVAEPPQG